MYLYEKKLQRIFYVLYDPSGNPKTGLLSTDLVFRFAKANQTTLTIKNLVSGTGGNFGELGQGYYWTDLSEEDTDTIGQFAIVVGDTSDNLPPSPVGPVLIDKKHVLYNISPQEVVASGTVPTCVVFGNVRDLSGEPDARKMKVVAQILRLPNTVNGNYISSKVRESFTDEDGLFKIRLAVGAIVRLEIAEAGVRRQFEVPDLTTANIIDLPNT